MTGGRVVHAHDPGGGQAGLLMTLTRSIPYVLTRRSAEPVNRNPIARAMIHRAAGMICPTREAADALRFDEQCGPIDIVEDLSHESLDGDVTDNRVAAEHLKIYRRALDSWRVPALLL